MSKTPDYEKLLKLEALANDPNAFPNERESARKKADELREKMKAEGWTFQGAKTGRFKVNKDPNKPYDSGQGQSQQNANSQYGDDPFNKDRVWEGYSPNSETPPHAGKPYGDFWESVWQTTRENIKKRQESQDRLRAESFKQENPSSALDDEEQSRSKISPSPDKIRVIQYRDCLYEIDRMTNKFCQQVLSHYKANSEYLTNKLSRNEDKLDPFYKMRFSNKEKQHIIYALKSTEAIIRRLEMELQRRNVI